MFTFLGSINIHQSNSGREFKNQELVEEVINMWPGLDMDNGKPRQDKPF